MDPTGPGVRHSILVLPFLMVPGFFDPPYPKTTQTVILVETGAFTPSTPPVGLIAVDAP